MGCIPTVRFSQPFILASQSPQRRRLLQDAGFAFRVIEPSPGAECGICSRETPAELVARLAWQKARDVADRVDEGCIIACDTLVFCVGQVLGKPADIDHARTMLRQLRGRPHHVLSGLCIWQRPRNDQQLDVVRTDLRMADISDADLEAYLESGQWRDKAGAFGYQDRLGWIEITAGSESNVIGLPMERLREMLQTPIDE